MQFHEPDIMSHMQLLSHCLTTPALCHSVPQYMISSKHISWRKGIRGQENMLSEKESPSYYPPLWYVEQNYQNLEKTRLAELETFRQVETMYIKPLGHLQVLPLSFPGLNPAAGICLEPHQGKIYNLVSISGWNVRALGDAHCLHWPRAVVNMP